MAASILGAPGAQAAGRYESVGSFGSSGSGIGQFSPTGRVAVDPASGDVLVIDRGLESGVPRVEVFAPEGNSATFLTQFGNGTLEAPTGIAIDAATGDVYISDAGAEKIFRYTSDGAATPVFTLDSSFPSPVAGPAAGQLGSFAAPLAFDDTDDRLVVADPLSNQVDLFRPDGSFESRFDGSDSGAPFSEIHDIAALPDGDILVADGQRVVRSDAGGAYVGTVGGLPGQPDVLGYDPLAREILVGHSGAFFEATVYRVSPLTNQFVGSLPDPGGEAFHGSVTGLAASSAGSVYVGTALDRLLSAFGLIGVQEFTTTVLPDVTVDPTSGITATGAHLSGAINPLGQPATHYELEYSGDGGSGWTLAAEGEATGESPQPVAANITGLSPNLHYQVRLRGMNDNGENISAVGEFVTAVAPPIVATGEATDRTTTAATLRGTVNPLGLQTSYHFEYGPDLGYGSMAPVGHEAVAGNGHSPLQVAQQVAGLQPGVTYHYRVVAENSAGRQIGEDRTFTTQAVAPPVRTYELVSPADKGGAQVQAYLGFQAAPDGSSMTFATQTAMSGSVQGEAAPQTPYYHATRSPQGWNTIGLDPPQIASGRNEVALFDTLAVSEDGSHALVISLAKLAPGAVEGDSNLYLRDTVTGAYTTIGVAPGNQYYYTVHTSPGFQFFVAGTSDFSRVVFDGGEAGIFIPGTPGGMYEWSHAGLRYVSVLPDGTPAESALDIDTDHARNRMSADGSRVFFSSNLALYVRENSSATVLVSASHQAGDLGAPRPGTFIGASRDGRLVYFVGQELTEDSPPTESVLYRADVDSGTIDIVAPLQGGGGLQVSQDGSRVYFTSRAQLTPSAPSGGESIYLWNSGNLQYVGPTGPSVHTYQASPDGRYFVFTSSEDVDGYESSGKMEAYLYDADIADLVCVSCRRDGVAPTGDVNIGFFKTNLSRHFPQAVLDDGRVYFDTPDRLISADANSARDVYEYDDGALRLISAGQSGGNSQLADVSADGNDVFFTTEDRLVRQDTDSARDVYDARVGGGIASQDAGPPSPECTAEGCREGSGFSPPAPSIGSEGTSGRPGLSTRPKRICKPTHRTTAAGKKQRCPRKHQKHQKHQKRQKHGGDRSKGR
jgi:hypothetical protein